MSDVQTATKPSTLRAWWFLILLSWQRQARAHLMIWISLGLAGFMTFLVLLNTAADRWNMKYWRVNDGRGYRHIHYFQDILLTQKVFPGSAEALAVRQIAVGAYYAVLERGTGFYVFSHWVVFSIFATFLLPIWSLSFATEGIGREREANNLSWLLMRPISRPAIYLAKYIAILPWALVLCLGGFALLCVSGGAPGRLAWQVYWPAVLLGTIAFTSLFHLMGAYFQKPAVVAILYSFFLESFMGNLPGYLKRFSVSFYVRCQMFDRAQDYGIRPDQPSLYLPVSGAIAVWAMIGITVGSLCIGMYVFSRKEYIESA